MVTATTTPKMLMAPNADRPNPRHARIKRAQHEDAGRFDLSAFGAISIFGVVVAVTMWVIQRWHASNRVHHREEVERLLALARSDSH